MTLLSKLYPRCCWSVQTPQKEMAPRSVRNRYDVIAQLNGKCRIFFLKCPMVNIIIFRQMPEKCIRKYFWETGWTKLIQCQTCFQKMECRNFWSKSHSFVEKTSFWKGIYLGLLYLSTFHHGLPNVFIYKLQISVSPLWDQLNYHFNMEATRNGLDSQKFFHQIKYTIQVSILQFHSLRYLN